MSLKMSSKKTKPASTTPQSLIVQVRLIALLLRRPPPPACTTRVRRLRRSTLSLPSIITTSPCIKIKANWAMLYLVDLLIGKLTWHAIQEWILDFRAFFRQRLIIQILEIFKVFYFCFCLENQFSFILHKVNY